MIERKEKPEPIRTLRIHFRDGTSGCYTINRSDVKDGYFLFRTTDGDTHLVPLRAVKEIVSEIPDEKS